VGTVVGETTTARAPDFAFLELDLLKVKGKTEATRIFTILGDYEFKEAKSFIDLTGPFGGVWQAIGRAGHYLRTGQPMRAVESVLPTAAANLPRAWREAHGGALTQRGNRIWDEQGKPYMPTAAETALRVAGFGSSRKATVQDRVWKIKQVMARYAEDRKAIYEGYRDYLANPDSRKLARVNQAIRKYNKRVKDNGDEKAVPLITKKSLKSQRNRMDKAPKRLREALQESGTEQ
jgi:hypothetical protein